MKIKEILDGWAYDFLDTLKICPPHIKKMSLDRLLICKKCDILDGKVCSRERGGCGCPISKKIISPSTKCPINKW